jgi:HTH-type transcriptional regulator/antitoxin HigA
MEDLMDRIDSGIVADLTLHVAAISKHVPLRPIRTEHDYDAAVASMNRLLDAGAADEAHPLADLVATLGELIGDYDAVNYPAADVAPTAVLRALMDQQGLTQSDLAQEVGSQGVVSEILSGKREMNLRQMRALAVRFSVPATAFVGGENVPEKLT